METIVFGKVSFVVWFILEFVAYTMAFITMCFIGAECYSSAQQALCSMVLSSLFFAGMFVWGVGISMTTNNNFVWNVTLTYSVMNILFMMCVGKLSPTIKPRKELVVSTPVGTPVGISSV
jgi:hypothetical protein